RAYPADMLDLNVRTDYRSLQRIGMLTGTGRDERRTLIESILSEGGIQTSLVRQFGVAGLSSQASFLSLLYYMGMLTLAQQPPNISVGAVGYRLEIPNRVIRELQWEHLALLLKDEGDLAIDTRDIEAALQAMAFHSDIEPFLALFHERVIKAMGLKDLRRFDEKSLKLMLLAFISLSRLFHPLSEREFAQGYCDLFLGASPLHPAAKYAWLLELKYLPASAKAAQIEDAFAHAAEQVARYAQDERLVPLLTQGQALKAGALVFVGARKPLFRAWPSDTPSTPPMARQRNPNATAKAAPARKRSPRKPATGAAPRKRTSGRTR
ncbi:MAG TPA: PD-(D/E)XK nuclease domain-containing protein, partial [Haliangium sp.]|nr:PD-(D/E)XK nuclease domain-containing protein [Haliangium sp.]